MATIAEKWLEQGIEQGIEQGREEGAQAVRNSILTILQLRFNLSANQLAAVTQRLTQITDLPTLQELNVYTVQANSLDEYLQRLGE